MHSLFGMGETGAYTEAYEDYPVNNVEGVISLRQVLHEPPGTYEPARGRKFMDKVRGAIRARHYSIRTEKSYCSWIKRFIFFHDLKHPSEMGEREINAFLTNLSVKRKVSASTQNQALCALLFLYRHVLGRKVGEFGDVIRARKPKRLPVVLTQEEVRGLLSNLSGDKWLMASLIYGAGLRLMECLRLRVQDIDFSRREILVLDGKGAKDRITMLPASLKVPLKEHLNRAKTVHDQDLAAGWGRVQMPDALDRKYPKAPEEWRRQWVFPQENRWKNNKSGREGRHHVHESIIQKAVAGAARRLDWPSTQPATPSAIPSPPICWNPGTIFEPSRNFWATRTSRRP